MIPEVLVKLKKMRSLRSLLIVCFLAASALCGCENDLSEHSTEGDSGHEDVGVSDVPVSEVGVSDAPVSEVGVLDANEIPDGVAVDQSHIADTAPFDLFYELSYEDEGLFFDTPGDWDIQDALSDGYTDTVLPGEDSEGGGDL